MSRHTAQERAALWEALTQNALAADIAAGTIGGDYTSPDRAYKRGRAAFGFARVAIDAYEALLADDVQEGVARIAERLDRALDAYRAECDGWQAALERTERQRDDARALLSAERDVTAQLRMDVTALATANVELRRKIADLRHIANVNGDWTLRVSELEAALAAERAKRCGTCRWWDTGPFVTVHGLKIDLKGKGRCACAASECCSPSQFFSTDHGCPHHERRPA